MNADFLAVLDYWEREKGISRDVLVAAVNEALLAAAKKAVGPAREGVKEASYKLAPREDARPPSRPSAYANGAFYSDASQFNLAQFGAALSVNRTSGGNVYSLSYAHGEIQLDGSRYRWTDGIGFEWRRQISAQSSFALIPQYARLSYSGDNSARNADLYALSAAYRHVWLKPWHPVLNAIAFYGDEQNLENRGDLGRQGARGGP